MGAGSIGRRHLANAALLARVAVCDADVGRARAAAGDQDARCFTVLEDALAWRPHGVVVATPHDSHLAVARAAVDAGADVLIEKPIAHRLDGVDCFLDRAETLGRRVFVGCNMRYHPGPATLRANLARIGRALFLRADYGNYLPDMRPGADYRALYCARRETGGGVILDAVHEIDYVTWLLGPVSGIGCEADRLGDLDIDVEDYAAIALRHASGARSEIHLDYLRRHKRRGCEIAGTEGSLIWRSEGKQPERCEVRLFRAAGGGVTTLFDDDALDIDQPYRDVIRDFAASLSSGAGTDLLSGRQAREVLAVALAAREAAMDGAACESPKSTMAG